MGGLAQEDFAPVAQRGSSSGFVRRRSGVRPSRRHGPVAGGPGSRPSRCSKKVSMDEDDKTLREWMATNVGGLREDRSTASYALEFLKTSKANAEMQHTEWLAGNIEERIEEVRNRIGKALETLKDI